jgi:YHS domain-containing protein
MKKLLVFAMMIALLTGISLIAKEKKETKQTKCPICNMEIKKDIYTDYRGMRIYFCSNDCIEKFKKDPKTYIAKMKKEGIKIAKAAKKEVKGKKKQGCAGLPCEATCGKK